MEEEPEYNEYNRHTIPQLIWIALVECYSLFISEINPICLIVLLLGGMLIAEGTVTLLETFTDVFDDE